MNLIDWMICEVLVLGISCNKCAYVDVVLVSAMIALGYSKKVIARLVLYCSITLVSGCSVVKRYRLSCEHAWLCSMSCYMRCILSE